MANRIHKSPALQCHPNRTQHSDAMNRRTLSPSMPKNSGHVLSIKSSWENRFNNDSNVNANTTRLSLDPPRRTSSGSKQEHIMNRYDQDRPSWSRTKTVKTMNTGTTSFTPPSYDQENGGDHVNRNGKSTSSLRPPNSNWEQTPREQPRPKAAKKKESGWVKQTDTDDTTSLSSHSNEISIGKTLSNISDVSAPSQASNRRYKSSLNYDGVAKNQPLSANNTKYSYSDSSRGQQQRPYNSGQLASKMYNETFVKKSNSNSSEGSNSTLNYSLEKLPSEDDTSKLNYPLERLSEGGDEETYYSRPSSVSDIEAKFMRDRKQDAEDDNSNSSSVDAAAYLQVYNRFNDKVSSVESVDSSLVYSMGNTVESSSDKKLSYSYSNDASESTMTASDLIASTLAECRLLLELSPPPTPMSVASSYKAKSFANSSVSNKEEKIGSSRSHVSKKDVESLASKRDHTIKSPVEVAEKVTSTIKTNPPQGRGSSEKFAHSGGGDRLADRQGSVSANNERTIPQQIRFSPKKDVERDLETLEIEDGYDHHKRDNTRVSLGSVSELSGHTSQYPEEPDTPVSRAEFRFMQRKEKLAQSLAKVNQLLERSRMAKDEASLRSNQEDLGDRKDVCMAIKLGMTRNEIALKSIEEELNDKKDAKNVLFEGDDNSRALIEKLTSEAESECNESAMASKKLSNQEPSNGFLQGDRNKADCNSAVADDKEADVEHKEQATQAGNEQTDQSTQFGVGVFCNDDSERPVFDTLWTDEAVCLGQPQEQQAQKQKRVKPELHVDTGNFTPLPHRKKHYLDLKDESTISSVSESRSKSIDVLSKSGTIGSSVNDIFRTNPSSPQISFGCFKKSISSDDSSSITDRDSDGMRLLGNSSTSKLGASSLSKLEKYGVKTASAAKLKEEHRCPQFLPSLNYSTMHDADELVGLVRDGVDGLAQRIKGGSKMLNSRSSPPKKILSHCKSFKGQLNPFVKAESFDEQSLVRNQNAPFEFAQHSCSFSPSSRSLRGALVTHKPKLHKRIIKKFKLGMKRKKHTKLYSR